MTDKPPLTPIAERLAARRAEAEEEGRWAQAQARKQRIEANVANALGVERHSLPFTDQADWFRRLGSFENPDPRFEAESAYWLINVGLQRLVAAHAVDIGPKVKNLLELTISEMSLSAIGAPTNDWDAEAVEELRALPDSTPFFSEATLYPLVGKEMGRTILALVNAVAAASGQGS